MKTIIHVNQHNIRSNTKGACSGMVYDEKPVLTVKTYKSNTKCNTVSINGPSRVVYSPDKPLACGAKVWIETTEEVICE